MWHTTRAASDATSAFGRFATAMGRCSVRAHTTATPRRQSSVPSCHGGVRPRLTNAPGCASAGGRRESGAHVASAAGSPHGARGLGPLASRSRRRHFVSSARTACRGCRLATLLACMHFRRALSPPQPVGRRRCGRLRPCPATTHSRIRSLLVFRLHAPAHGRRSCRRSRTISRGLAYGAHKLHTPSRTSRSRHRTATCSGALPPRASCPGPCRLHRLLLVLHLKVLLRRCLGQNRLALPRRAHIPVESEHGLERAAATTRRRPRKM